MSADWCSHSSGRLRNSSLAKMRTSDTTQTQRKIGATELNCQVFLDGWTTRHSLASIETDLQDDPFDFIQADFV